MKGYNYNNITEVANMVEDMSGLKLIVPTDSDDDHVDIIPYKDECTTNKANPKVKQKKSGRTKKVVVVPESIIRNDKIRVLIMLCLYGNSFPVKLLGLTSIDDTTKLRVALYSSRRCKEDNFVTSAEISIESIEHYIIQKNDKKETLPSNLYEKIDFLTSMVDNFGTCTRFQLHHGCRYGNLWFRNTVWTGRHLFPSNEIGLWSIGDNLRNMSCIHSYDENDDCVNDFILYKNPSCSLRDVIDHDQIYNDDIIGWIPDITKSSQLEIWDNTVTDIGPNAVLKTQNGWTNRKVYNPIDDSLLDLIVVLSVYPTELHICTMTIIITLSEEVDYRKYAEEMDLQDWLFMIQGPQPTDKSVKPIIKGSPKVISRKKKQDNGPKLFLNATGLRIDTLSKGGKSINIYAKCFGTKIHMCGIREYADAALASSLVIESLKQTGCATDSLSSVKTDMVLLNSSMETGIDINGRNFHNRLKRDLTVNPSIHNIEYDSSGHGAVKILWKSIKYPNLVDKEDAYIMCFISNKKKGAIIITGKLKEHLLYEAREFILDYIYKLDVFKNIRVNKNYRLVSD